MSSAVAQTLLSNREYDIEFNGFLSNHAKHAIIALDKLDAPDDRIQEWWDTYTKITPYSLSIDRVETPWDEVRPCSLHEWNEWRGQKRGWQSMCMFLRRELEGPRFDGDTDKLIQTYAPPLLPGMAGSLTHGIIHLGWAIDGRKNSWMILEGLAYLNFCYVDMKSNATDGESSTTATNDGTVPEAGVDGDDDDDDSPLASLTRIAQIWHEKDLASEWIRPTKAKYDESFHPELVRAGFQWQFAKVLREPHPVATRTPRWLRSSSSGEVKLESLWEMLYHAVTCLYLCSRNENNHGSFLILHAITSLWGLEHVLRVIGNDDEAFIRKTLGQYYSMVVCLLATSTMGFPDGTALQNVAMDEVPFDRVDPIDWDWNPIVTASFAEEEEHNIKLVYVMKELWKRYGRWHGFTEAAQSFTETPAIL